MFGRKHPFLGQFVALTLKTSVSVSDGVVSKTSPLSVSGYLLGVTGTHYVLGDIPTKPAVEILKSETVVLETTRKKLKKKKKEEDLLDFDEPTDPCKIN